MGPYPRRRGCRRALGPVAPPVATRHHFGQQLSDAPPCELFQGDPSRRGRRRRDLSPRGNRCHEGRRVSVWPVRSLRSLHGPDRNLTFQCLTLTFRAIDKPSENARSGTRTHTEASSKDFNPRSAHPPSGYTLPLPQLRRPQRAVVLWSPLPVTVWSEMPTAFKSFQPQLLRSLIL